MIEAFIMFVKGIVSGLFQILLAAFFLALFIWLLWSLIEWWFTPEDANREEA